MAETDSALSNRIQTCNIWRDRANRRRRCDADAQTSGKTAANIKRSAATRTVAAGNGKMVPSAAGWIARAPRPTTVAAIPNETAAKAETVAML